MDNFTDMPWFSKLHKHVFVLLPRTQTVKHPPAGIGSLLTGYGDGRVIKYEGVCSEPYFSCPPLVYEHSGIWTSSCSVTGVLHCLLCVHRKMYKLWLSTVFCLNVAHVNSRPPPPQDASLPAEEGKPCPNAGGEHPAGAVDLCF